MYLVLIVLIVLAALLLILFVLIQNSKGGGLTSNLTGGTQFGGVAEQKSKLEQVTWGLIIFIAVMSIAASVMGPNKSTSSAVEQKTGVQDIMINQINPSTTTEQPALDAQPAN